MTLHDQEKKRVRRVKDYQFVFKGKEGERVLADMMSRYHMLGPVMDDSSLQIAYKEGQRNVVLEILNLLNTDEYKLIKALEDRYKGVSDE